LPGYQIKKRYSKYEST